MRRKLSRRSPLIRRKLGHQEPEDLQALRELLPTILGG
jgi:hypothetical protein